MDKNKLNNWNVDIEEFNKIKKMVDDKRERFNEINNENISRYCKNCIFFNSKNPQSPKCYLEKIDMEEMKGKKCDEIISTYDYFDYIEAAIELRYGYKIHHEEIIEILFLSSTIPNIVYNINFSESIKLFHKLHEEIKEN